MSTDPRKPKKSGKGLSESAILGALNSDVDDSSILSAIGESIAGGNAGEITPNDSVAGANMEAASPATDPAASGTGMPVAEVSHAERVGQKPRSKQQQVMDKFKATYGDQVEVRYNHDTQDFWLVSSDTFSRSNYAKIGLSADKLDKNNADIAYIRSNKFKRVTVPASIIKSALDEEGKKTLRELTGELNLQPGFGHATLQGDKKGNYVIDVVEAGASVLDLLKHNPGDTGGVMESLITEKRSVLKVPAADMYPALDIQQEGPAKA